MRMLLIVLSSCTYSPITCYSVWAPINSMPHYSLDLYMDKTTKPTVEERMIIFEIKTPMSSGNSEDDGNPKQAPHDWSQPSTKEIVMVGSLITSDLRHCAKFTQCPKPSHSAVSSMTFSPFWGQNGMVSWWLHFAQFHLQLSDNYKHLLTPKGCMWQVTIMNTSARQRLILMHGMGWNHHDLILWVQMWLSRRRQRVLLERYYSVWDSWPVMFHRKINSAVLCYLWYI